MPHINNKRFLQYAVNIMHHTIGEVNASQIEDEIAATRQRSASAPPPQVRSSPLTYDDQPLNLTTPPRKKPKQSQSTLTYVGSQTSVSHPPSQASTSSYSPPQSGSNQTLNQRSCYDPTQGVFPAPQNASGQSSHGLHQSQSANPAPYDQAAVYDSNRQLQRSNLVPGTVAPPFLVPHPVGSSSSHTTLDPSGKVYTNLQPAQLTNVELLPPASWQTPGPAPPSAVPQVSPTATMEANLKILGQHIQQTSSRLVRVKQEKNTTPAPQEGDDDQEEDVDVDDDVDSSAN